MVRVEKLKKVVESAKKICCVWKRTMLIEALSRMEEKRHLKYKEDKREKKK